MTSTGITTNSTRGLTAGCRRIKYTCPTKDPIAIPTSPPKRLTIFLRSAAGRMLATFYSAPPSRLTIVGPANLHSLHLALRVVYDAATGWAIIQRSRIQLIHSLLDLRPTEWCHRHTVSIAAGVSSAPSCQDLVGLDQSAAHSARHPVVQAHLSR